MNDICHSLRNLIPPFLLIASSNGLLVNHYFSTRPIGKTPVSGGSSGSGFQTTTRTTNARTFLSSTPPPPTTTTIKTRTRSLAASNNNNTPKNPLASMLGDLASSLLSSQKSSLSLNPELDATLTQVVSSCSWDDVRSRLESLQTPEERTFRDNLTLGYGEGSALHKIRLHDESNKESDVRVTFYRDHASWCPYCQKVWFALEEKRIPYRVEKVNMNCYGNKPREFLRLQPNGQIPVVVIDGRVYGSSNSILSALESLFPDHKSLTPLDGNRARELLQLEQALAGAWLGWLRSSGGGGGGDQEYMEKTLGRVERALQESGGPFFMGADVTMVDVQFLSFLERMCASLLYYKGFVIRVPPGHTTTTKAWPGINQWFDALEERPSYQVTKSDYYTHAWDLPPQLGGCGAEPAGESYRHRIDGGSSSWELPPTPHNGGIEPDWGSWANGDDDAAAKREAVERLSWNHRAVVEFAARGAGKKGLPPVGAPLADPNATPNQAVRIGVDAVLRIVATKMLKEEEEECSSNDDETQNEHALMIRLSDSIREREDDYAKELIASVAYLRDRIGVPRDMRLPAARQLRAHLNWAIHAIGNSSSS